MRGRGGRKRPADDGWAERGGYMNAKMQKLEEQNLAVSLDSQLFNGITIYVNGYTKPTSEELKVMVTKNGGVYTHYYSKTKVTHIIASNLPTSKINHLKDEKVCSPEWIVESLQAGKLLPYQKYLLYTPQNLQQHNILTSLKALQTTSVDIQSAAETPRDTCTSNDTTKFPSEENKPTANENASKKTNDQNFVAEFYNRSRLHHISMWGAESKAYVAQLQKQMSEDKSTPVFKGLERLTREVQASVEEQGRYLLENGQKVFAHIDIDCFFVSVGLLKRPELRGQPVAVTHSKGRDPSSGSVGDTGGFNSRSDVASCSYEARKMGVRNGMHFGDAKKVCPDLIAIPYDFEAYKSVSQKFYDTVLSYTLEVEAISCDELYIDCSDLICQSGASPLQLASCLRKDIFEATACNSSCGLGSNMLIARLSTKHAKPNGHHYVERGGEIDFMREIKVSDLPGIGHVMTNKLTSMGIKKCEELSKLPVTELQKMFGAKVGSRLFKQARGDDDRTLSVDLERKSVSAEINYGIRFTQKREADNFIKELAKEVQNRLQQINKKGRHLTLKIKVRQEGAPIETYKYLGHGLCDNVSKSHMLPTATDSADIIGQECCNLLALLNHPVEDLRGIGIQVTSLEAPIGRPTNPVTKNSILKYATAKPKDLLQSENGDKISENKQSNLLNKNALVSQESTTRPKEPENFFISLSQVDMDTLNELPEDIQQEIMAAMKKQKGETNLDQGNNGEEGERPGCSHWNEPPVADGKVEKALKDRTSVNPEMEDIGGLDESFLRAMPENIRRELLDAHKRPTLLKSSPTKKLPQAPKSTRGRKKGSLNNVTTKATAKSKVLTKNQQTLKDIIKPKATHDVNLEVDKIQPRNIRESRVEVETHLKGYVEVYDIKQLITHWSSQPAPNQDDLDSLLEFLLKLVQESDIEKVFIILRGIQRMENVTPQWKEEMKSITTTVQAAVKAIYGGKLKMLSS